LLPFYLLARKVSADALLTGNNPLSHDRRSSPDTSTTGCWGGSMRISLDWWAVLAAAAAVILIKIGLVSGIPW
jgi:hypothetical protein